LPKTATLDEFARLSSETARLKDELASLRAVMAESPSLSLADQNQLPITGHHKAIRALKVYTKWTDLPEEARHRFIEEDKRRIFEDNFKTITVLEDDLIFNALTIIDLGIQNVGRSLVEHVVLDVTLTTIWGFRCGPWDGNAVLESGDYVVD